MKTIAVSQRAKTLNALLNKARRKTIILQSADGERFALTSVNNWDGFDVGAGTDFALEVERTGKNKKLMRSLSGRRKRSQAAGIPLAAVRKQLGLG
ncbi:MAG: hypothetical protein EXS05_20600 [Planctomycetaceae bacterium]|nr:hypothetical protein [Planctomycetaceae bacterium]